MSEKETVTFSMKLSSIQWDKKPIARIYLDDKLIQEITVEKEHGKESDIVKKRVFGYD